MCVALIDLSFQASDWLQGSRQFAAVRLLVRAWKEVPAIGERVIKEELL
jgi:hypothetical protein